VRIEDIDFERPPVVWPEVAPNSGELLDVTCPEDDPLLDEWRRLNYIVNQQADPGQRTPDRVALERVSARGEAIREAKRLVRERFQQSRDRLGFRVGWDPATVSDYSAIVIAERFRQPDGGARYQVRHIERRRGLDTTVQVREVIELLRTPALADRRTELVIDRTGMGIGVADRMVEAARSGELRAKVSSIAITSGENPDSQKRTVPKLLLLQNLLVVLEQDRLDVVDSLDGAPAWRAEMLSFQRRATERGHVSLQAAGAGHDDLVLATALAVWEDARRPPPTDLKIPLDRRVSPWSGGLAPSGGPLRDHLVGGTHVHQ
jgi:hypothetical protein